ncbi:MAG: S1C family serine protease [Lewinella sp.]|jgi:S1-C subfamily serine protease|uniref:S1C family serine protease n=1 Tax=Lewinella sp. TaxID=2004506 RepID=UPI003D6BDFC5
MRVLLWVLFVVVSFLGGMLLMKQQMAETIPTEENNALLVRNENTAPTTNPSLAPAPATVPLGMTPQEQHTIQLFEQAAPSVCFITTSTLRRNYYSRNVEEIPSGSGSGFVWDKSGHIVTNYHVIQNADKATVTLSNGKTYQATKVGQAPEKDLAVLKINIPRDELTPIPVGTSINLRVGQNVYAIGNPFGLDQTLTTGVVSALGREIKSVAGIPIRDVIQSDAAINPGNSGGPLLNSSGELIGVNTAIYSPSGASAGIGFSIPVDVVNWVIPDLIQYGEVNRPLIGVELTRPLRNISGAVVLNVVKDSPAETAGLIGTKADNNGNIILGDIIVAVNNDPITTNSDLYLALEKYQAGDQVNIRVKRDDREVAVALKLRASAEQ